MDLIASGDSKTNVEEISSILTSTIRVKTDSQNLFREFAPVPRLLGRMMLFIRRPRRLARIAAIGVFGPSGCIDRRIRLNGRIQARRHNINRLLGELVDRFLE